MATSISTVRAADRARIWLKVVARPDDRCRFWLDEPGRWPRDPAGYVFLARAVHEIGKVMFPADWTGGEPTVMLPSYENANGALCREMSAFHRQSLLDGSHAELSALLSEVKKRRAQLIPAVDRLQAVQECIIVRAEAGELETAVRAQAGGEMRSLKPSMWNGRVEPRFYWCQMSTQKPFGIAVDGPAFDLIFIPRASLDRLLRTLSGEMPEPAVASIASATDVEVAPSPADADAMAPLELASPEVATPPREAAPLASEPYEDMEPAPTEPKAARRPRRDIERGDEKLATALNRLVARGPKLMPDREKPSALGLAKALLEAEPDLARTVGDIEALRKIFSDKSDRVNRLVAEGRIEPWWRRLFSVDA